MKNLLRIIAIFCLLCFYCYFINIINFPNTIITYSESLESYKLCPFLKLKGETTVATTSNTSNYNLTLNLGSLELKQIDLTVLEKSYVVPIGKMVGIKLYIDGVMIVRIF